MRYNPSVSFVDTSLYTREAFPLRREWADEGIGPYKHPCKTYRHKKGPEDSTP